MNSKCPHKSSSANNVVEAGEAEDAKNCGLSTSGGYVHYLARSTCHREEYSHVPERLLGKGATGQTIDGCRL